MDSLISSNANGSSSSDEKNQSGYNGRLVWIYCQVALSLMTVILIYIFVCLIWFVKCNPASNTTLTVKSLTKSENGRHMKKRIIKRSGSGSISNKRRRLRRWMRYACLLAATSTLLKCLVDQVKFFYAWNARSNLVCEIIYDVTDIIIFAMAYMGVYSFLWIKQWLFYCDPVAVKFLYSRRLVIFSRVFVVIVLVVSLAVAVANWIPTRYKISNSTATTSEELKMDNSYVGCVAVYDMTDPRVQWPLVTYAVLNATFQATLMGLFVYPLAWDRLNKWKSAKKEVSPQNTLPGLGQTSKRNSPMLMTKVFHVDNISVDSKTDSAIVGRRHFTGSEQLLSENAIRSIRRTIFWTFVCIVTDASLVAGFAVISVGTPQVLIAVVTNFDLLMNIVCILATYTRWKEIVFPICVKKKLPRNSSTGFSSHDGM